MRAFAGMASSSPIRVRGRDISAAASRGNRGWTPWVLDATGVVPWQERVTSVGRTLGLRAAWAC
jgi:hypothetical protein